MSKLKEKDAKFETGKNCSKDCYHCCYATIGKNYVNCQVINGCQSGHRQLDSTHGLVIRPRKNGSCDYQKYGNPSVL